MPATEPPLDPITIASSGAAISVARRLAKVSTSSERMVGAPWTCSTTARIMESEQSQALEQGNHFRAHVAVLAEHLHGMPRLNRELEAQLLQSAVPPRRPHPLDLLLLGLQPTRKRWIARQVEAFLHGDHRR